MVFNRLWSHVRTPLFGNAYALVANQGINAVLGVVFWVAAARLFPTDAVGANAALLSTMTFVALVGQLGMRNAMTWMLPAAGSARARYIARAYLVSLAVSGVLAPVMVLLFSGIEDGFLPGGPAFVIGFTFAAALSAIFAMQDGVLVGLRAARWVPVENAGFGLAKLLLLPLLTTARLGIFAAWTLATVPFVLLVNALVFGRVLPRMARAAGTEEPPSGTGVMRFVTGDFAGNLMVQGTIRLMPVLILAVLGSTANAYAFQAWTLALPLFFVAGSMVSSMTVESLTTPASAGDYARRMLVSMLRLLVPTSLALAIAAPWVLHLFGAAYAQEASPLLAILAATTIPITLNAWFYSLCRIRGTIAPLLVCQMFVASMTVGLTFLLLPRIGIIGSGIGWFAGQACVAIYVLLREFRWSCGAGLSWPRGGLDRGWRADRERAD